MGKSFGNLDWDDIVSGKLSVRSEHVGKGVGKYAVVVNGTATFSTHRTHAAALKAAEKLKKQMQREGDDGEVMVIDLSEAHPARIATRQNKCKNCGKLGHNARTCPNA